MTYILERLTINRRTLVTLVVSWAVLALQNMPAYGII